MKILVAYDGSAFAEFMLDSLADAGLPGEVEATVLSVAERWFPAGKPDSTPDDDAGLTAAHRIAERGARRLIDNFPAWSVDAAAAAGSPAERIMESSAASGADLIVMGALGHNALERLFMGSVSHKVANEANCSVRVCRYRPAGHRRPQGIVVGYDGTRASEAAVQAVANRSWPTDSSVLLLTTVGFGYSPVAELELAEDYDRARDLQRPAEDILRRRGLAVTAVVIEDDPKLAIVREAEELSADSVFIGHNDHNLAYRLLLGTVASAVLARVSCSVEIVRGQK